MIRSGNCISIIWDTYDFLVLAIFTILSTNSLEILVVSCSPYPVVQCKKGFQVSHSILSLLTALSSLLSAFPSLPRLRWLLAVVCFFEINLQPSHQRNSIFHSSFCAWLISIHSVLSFESEIYQGGGRKRKWRKLDKPEETMRTIERTVSSC